MRYVNLHTHSASNREDVVEIVNRSPHETDALPNLFSIGIHPWYLDPERLDAQLATMEITAAHPGCAAIGECGLDSRIEKPLAEQEPVFIRQLELAMRHRKPVVLHMVGAFDRLIAIVREVKPGIPLIVHGFSKSRELALQLEREGFYLSFGKYLLRNPGLREAFTAVAPEKIFLETDTIEQGIEEVYALAARYRDCTREEMAHQVGQNFNTVFGRNLF